MPDLVIVGAQGQSRLKVLNKKHPSLKAKTHSHFFLGSVAEHVVRYAPCSVMAFCPKKERQRRLGYLKGSKS